MVILRKSFENFVQAEVMNPLAQNVYTKLSRGSRYKTGKMRRQTSVKDTQKGFRVEVNTDYAERVDDKYGYMKSGQTISQVIDKEVEKL